MTTFRNDRIYHTSFCFYLQTVRFERFFRCLLRLEVEQEMQEEANREVDETIRNYAPKDEFGNPEYALFNLFNWFHDKWCW